MTFALSPIAHSLRILAYANRRIGAFVDMRRTPRYFWLTRKQACVPGREEVTVTSRHSKEGSAR